jgi:hypothetical protein
MSRAWLVRILVDTGGHATDELVTAIRERLTTWPTASVIAEPDQLVRIVAMTDVVMRREAKEVASYLEAAVRSVCREARRDDVVVQISAVEPLGKKPTDDASRAAAS